MLAFLDTFTHKREYTSLCMTSGLETKTTCQQIVKVTLMVAASLAAAVVCSFDCLWVSKMVLGKQINTLTPDKQSTETVPTCKCPVSIPPRVCERGGWYVLGKVTEFTETGSFPCTSPWREVGSVV